jgi:hypothetical protein
LEPSKEKIPPFNEEYVGPLKRVQLFALPLISFQAVPVPEYDLLFAASKWSINASVTVVEAP